MKAWWLGFPRFHCPHCGKPIEGVKFVGHFKLPKARGTRDSDTSDGPTGHRDNSLPQSAAAKRSPRARKARGAESKREVVQEP